MTTDTIERETDTALIAVPQGQDAYALFTANNTTAADKVLAMVRAKVDAFKADMPDISTEAGRKKIKSFAYKIAQSKTAVDGAGEALTKEAKEIPKRIDANRKHIRDTLDAWRDEVRQPVTDWEAAEEARIDRIKVDLAELEGTINDPLWMQKSSECLRDRLGEIEKDFHDIGEARFGEYNGAAEELKTKAIQVLAERVAIAEKREAEASELDRLRKEAAENARKEHERRIAEEAAESAKRETEAKAEAERRAAEKREADLKAELAAAAAKAERDKKEAVERAAKAAKDAVELAERLAREAKEREEIETRRREQDKAHRAAINREALAAFVENGLSEDVAKQVVTLIASRSIPNISINY